MQRYNAKIIHLAQKKIARVNNSVCNLVFIKFYFI
jgi:hypothetical protein